MFLLIPSVAHETVSVNEEMGKWLALHLKKGEMNRNVVGKKEGVGQMKIESQGVLLLPQVATAHNWNRTQFLQQACKKAKLPVEAWQDSETEIYLFGSQVFGEEP